MDKNNVVTKSFSGSSEKAVDLMCERWWNSMDGNFKRKAVLASFTSIVVGDDIQDRIYLALLVAELVEK